MKKINILYLSLIILILNLIWEFSHYILYIDLSGIAPIPHLILASFTDVLLILAIFTVISLKNKNLTWIKKPKKIDYLIILSLGVIISSIIELRVLNIGRWVYTELMPTIFNIGLSPLIQLFTTAILALHLNKLFNKF